MRRLKNAVIFIQTILSIVLSRKIINIRNNVTIMLLSTDKHLYKFWLHISLREERLKLEESYWYFLRFSLTFLWKHEKSIEHNLLSGYASGTFTSNICCENCIPSFSAFIPYWVSLRILFDQWIMELFCSAQLQSSLVGDNSLVHMNVEWWQLLSYM